MFNCPAVHEDDAMWWGHSWCMHTPLEMIDSGTLALFRLFSLFSETSTTVERAWGVLAIDRLTINSGRAVVAMVEGAMTTKGLKASIHSSGRNKAQSPLKLFSPSVSTGTGVLVSQRGPCHGQHVVTANGIVSGPQMSVSGLELETDVMISMG